MDLALSPPSRAGAAAPGEKSPAALSRKETPESKEALAEASSQGSPMPADPFAVVSVAAMAAATCAPSGQDGQFCPPTEAQKNMINCGELCVRCYKPPSTDSENESKVYSTNKMIHRRCYNAEHALRTWYKVNKPEKTWALMSQLEKDELIQKNADQESQLGKQRELIHEQESIHVKDKMAVQKESPWCNQFEFCDMLKARWGISKEDAMKEFKELLEDKSVTKLLDEKNYPTVNKYSRLAERKGRALGHTQSLTTNVVHEGLKQGQVKLLASSLAAPAPLPGSLAAVAGLWDHGTFNCLVKPANAAILDRRLNSKGAPKVPAAGAGAGGGRGLKRAREEGAAAEGDGPAAGPGDPRRPGPVPLSQAAAAIKQASEEAAEAELNKVRRIDRAANLIKKWEVRLVAAKAIVTGAMVVASGREHECASLQVMDRIAREMSAMLSDPESGLLNDDERKTALAIRGAMPETPELESFDVLLAAKVKALERNKLQVKKQLDESKKKVQENARLAKAEAKLAKEEESQKKLYETMFGRWPALVPLAQNVSCMGTLPAQGLASLSGGCWGNDARRMKMLSGDLVPKEMEAVWKEMAQEHMSKGIPMGEMGLHYVEGSAAETILPGSPDVCHHVKALKAGLDAQDFWIEGHLEEVQKMLQLRMQVCGKSFEWCGLTDRAMPLLKYVVCGTLNVIITASVEDARSLLPESSEGTTPTLTDMCSTFMSTELAELMQLDSFSLASAGPGNVVVLPPNSICYEASANGVAAVRALTITKDSLPVLTDATLEKTTELVGAGTQAERIALATRFLQMVRQFSDETDSDVDDLGLEAAAAAAAARAATSVPATSPQTPVAALAASAAPTATPAQEATAALAASACTLAAAAPPVRTATAPPTEAPPTEHLAGTPPTSPALEDIYIYFFVPEVFPYLGLDDSGN